MTELYAWEDVRRRREKRANATGIAGFRYRAVDRYKVCRNWVREVPRQIRWAWQRALRGWDDRSVWCLHDHLAKTLGAQLVHMADTSYSYPGDAEYPTFELWTADLRRHGEALLALHKGSFDCETSDEEVALWRPAHEAVHWVADHLVGLWD